MEKEFKRIDEVHIGMKVFDTYNQFADPTFNFIEGESFDPEKAMVTVVDKTSNSVCVALNKFPLRIQKDNGAVTNPINCTQWFKFTREHQYEIGFPWRFKKFNPSTPAQ